MYFASLLSQVYSYSYLLCLFVLQLLTCLHARHALTYPIIIKYMFYLFISTQHIVALYGFLVLVYCQQIPIGYIQHLAKTMHMSLIFSNHLNTHLILQIVGKHKVVAHFALDYQHFILSNHFYFDRQYLLWVGTLKYV